MKGVRQRYAHAQIRELARVLCEVNAQLSARYSVRVVSGDDVRRGYRPSPA